MAAEQDAKAAAFRGFVDFAGFPRDELGEGRGETLEIGRGGEADFSVDREGQEAGPLLLRGRPHPRDVADDVAGGVDEMFGGETILRAGLDRVAAARSHHGGIDDERVGARGQDPLDTAAALTLLDEMHQAGLLELAQVVVHALAPELHLGGELRGRRRLPEPIEQPPPDRRQGHLQPVGLVEQRDRGGSHTGMLN